MVSRQECDEVFRKIGYDGLIYKNPEAINTPEKLEQKCREYNGCLDVNGSKDMINLKRCHTSLCDKKDTDQVCLDKKLDYFSKANATDIKIYKNLYKCSPYMPENGKKGRQYRRNVKEKLRKEGYNPDSLKDRFQNFKEYLFNISNCLYVVEEIEKDRYKTVMIYNDSRKKSDLYKSLTKQSKLVKKYTKEHNKLNNTVTKLEDISRNTETLRQFKTRDKKTKKRDSLKNKLDNLVNKQESLRTDLENYEYNTYSKNKYETFVNIGKYLKLKRKDIPCKLLNFLISRDDIFISNIHENSYVFIPVQLFLDNDIDIPLKYKLEYDKIIERSKLTKKLVKPSSSSRTSRSSSGSRTSSSRSSRRSTSSHSRSNGSSRRSRSQSAGNSIKNKNKNKNKRHTRKVKRTY